MMPACTGLPPGLLMRRTTPAVLVSSKAARSAVITVSAETSPCASITPFMSTSAVCRSASFCDEIGQKPANASSTTVR